MKNNSRAFVNQLLIWLLVTMAFGGSIGLGTVWLRHQNSLMAKANSDLVARLAKVERRNDEIATLIQSEQRPELLRQRNLEMRLGLVPLSEIPIVQVRENVVDRLVERANRGLFSDAPAGPAPLQINIAQR